MSFQELTDQLADHFAKEWPRWQSEFKAAHPELELEKDFTAYLLQKKHIRFEDIEELFLNRPIQVSSEYAPEIDAKMAELRQQIFERRAELGKGAMGVVHLAKDKTLLRQVAYKELLSEAQFFSPLAIRRFLNEVQITAQLEHPNIVPIYQMTPNPDGTLSYAMKWVKGKTLKELILESQTAYSQNREPEASLDTLLDYFLNVCDALEYAHSKQVIHRDLKPANIMIGPYQDVYVMDWGIAKRMDIPEIVEPTEGATESQETQMGQVLGTPRYMSPQQAAGKNNELDGQSDQFALGLILFEIVMLKPAFQNAKNQIDLLRKILSVDLAPFEAYHPNRPVHPNLIAMIQKATQKKTHQRYANVGELAKDLRRHLKGQPIQARTESHWEKLLRSLRKHGKYTGIAVLSLVFLSLASISFSLYYQIQASQKAQSRQRSLSQFQALISERSQWVEKEFIRIESLVSGLANAAKTALLQSSPVPSDYYLASDYGTEAHVPPDYREAQAYQRKISLKHLSIVIPPQTEAAALEAEIFKLNRLRFLFYDQYKTANQQGSPDDNSFQEQARKRIGHVIWSYVSLENGLHISYPGKGPYAKDYDPRTRPWYMEAKRQKDIFWGSPYLDISGQGLVLPCLMPIRDYRQNLMGVSGFDTQVNHIVNRFMDLPSIPGLKRALMLNQHKDIFLQAQSAEQHFQTVHPAVPFDIPEIKSRLVQGQHGYSFYEKDLWIYYYFETMNWFLLIQADPTHVMQEL